MATDAFLFRAKVALEHLRSAIAVLGRPASELTIYEFGAGADLAGPLTIAAFGVRSQRVIDQDVLLRPTLVHEVLGRLREHSATLGTARTLQLQARARRELVRELREIGIEYLAPRDARSTGFPPASVDLITSNSTMEHIPRADLPLVLEECRRVLKPDGLMCFRIDYEDHYAILDHTISPYNFLQFSDQEWQRYNSRLQFQNRLRHRDYVEMFRTLEFETLSVTTLEASVQALAAVSLLKLAREFDTYSPAELATRKGTFLVRPKRTGGNRA